MPLDKSGSKESVGKNISELKDTGRPHKQAVAIAMKTQREAKGFNKGGVVSGEQAFENNVAETIANPTGRVGLEKGGEVKAKGMHVPRATGGWKRWGQK